MNIITAQTGAFSSVLEKILKKIQFSIIFRLYSSSNFVVSVIYPTCLKNDTHTQWWGHIVLNIYISIIYNNTNNT